MAHSCSKLKFYVGIHQYFYAFLHIGKKIYITGKGCHGAMPNTGVDPLNVMSHIHIALQAINARELDPMDNLVLTVGQMHGGQTSNVIPNEAMMSGTIRTLKNETRATVKARMEAIVASIATAFNAEARVEWGAGCPVLIQNELTGHLVVAAAAQMVLLHQFLQILF